MPELRKDPVLKRWVIIATERASRPNDFKKKREDFPANQDLSKCPFCPGNEFMTPPEVLAYRKPGTLANGPGWWIRVINNKFPALNPEGSLDKKGIGIYDMMNGVGYHEVLIETDDHFATPLSMSSSQFEEIIWGYRDRIIELSKDVRIKYVIIFKNHGKGAGASLFHPHSQIIATPIIPAVIKNEIDNAKEYFELRDRCLFCDIVTQELGHQDRIVFENNSFIAFCPFASAFPFETWIIPKRHFHRFEDIDKNHVVDLAQTMKSVFSKLYLLLDNPPFNMMLHTSPPNSNSKEYYHWHIEIIPRLTEVAGFEWGTGTYINPMLPERAAIELRKQEIT
jgi:UDPglucose--hexose-1-phosphate uridylyltransferase